MGLGSTAKKLQKVVDMADELYSKISDLRDQMNEIRKTIETTNERVGSMESDLARQRELLEAIAENEGIDVDDYRPASDPNDETEAVDGGTESETETPTE
jgi:DNA anti-recombination protein RmuC